MPTIRMTEQTTTIPARYARAALVKRRWHVTVTNTYGTQVVDCWAFNPDDMNEFMSMEHTRVALDRYRPKIGDILVTNRRRPILRIVEDTCGVHDTLLAACDQYRYQQLGCKEYHRNCDDNMWEAMIAAGYRPSETPSPFNLWQNTPIEADGLIGQYPAASKKGDFIKMRAEMDLVICLSTCPQDITRINSGRPRSARLHITRK